MKEKKKALVLVVLFILSVSIYACGKDNPSLQQEDLKMISPAKENEEGRQEDLIEKEDGKDKQEDLAEKEGDKEGSQKQPVGDIPEFLENYFEFGTYSKKIRIPNADNMEYVAITEENRIEIPECNVLSILFNTLYNDIVLYEGSPEEIKDFFGEIQKLEFQKEKEYVDTLPLNADCVFEADSIMVNGHSNYIRIHIRSFSDGMHYFDIHQENQEVIYASAKSESLLDMVKTMAGLKSIDINKSEGIEKLEAFIDNVWQPLDEEKKELFQFIIKEKVEKIKNYSGGCPFEYKLKATLHDGETVDIYYASDSCGALVIGDSTYEVELAPEEGEEFKYRNQLADFFGKP